MIYAIRAEGTGYVKFGRTNKPILERIRELQTGCPFQLELLAISDGGRIEEMWIHMRLVKAKAHYRGEWFTDCEEANNIVAEMSAKTLKADGIALDELKMLNRKKGRLGKVLDFAQRQAGGWRG